MLNRRLRSFATILFFAKVLLFVFGVLLEVSQAADTPTALDIKRLLPDSVGAAVLAVDDGKVKFEHAWGVRHLERPEPCTSTTNFRLASVSKQFTASAVMLLVDRGRLDFTETIDRYFTECPEYWQQITIHNLLTHTSGLPDYEKLIPEGTSLQLSDQNLLEILLKTKEPLFQPGTRFAYSNTGYALLGLIVEKVSGKPFQEFMKSEVFQSVGMNRTVLYVAGFNRVSERAFGHTLTKRKQWKVDDQSLTSAIRGDGCIYSSLADLKGWLKALNQRQLLSESAYKAMWSPQVKTNRGKKHYGYGWFIDEYRGQPRLMHGGSTRGFSLMLQYFPKRNAGVVILRNSSGSAASDVYVERIVDRLLYD